MLRFNHKIFYKRSTYKMYNLTKRVVTTQRSIVKNNIIVTDIAFEKIKEIVKKTNKEVFLLSVKGGGCGGFNYSFIPLDKKEFEEINRNKLKPTIIEQNNTKVVIDPVAEFHLLGTTIDYIKEDYQKGLFDGQFKFIPNKEIASSCGCGISFSLKNL